MELRDVAEDCAGGCVDLFRRLGILDLDAGNDFNIFVGAGDACVVVGGFQCVCLRALTPDVSGARLFGESGSC